MTPPVVSAQDRVFESLGWLDTIGPVISAARRVVVEALATARAAGHAAGQADMRERAAVAAEECDSTEDERCRCGHKSGHHQCGYEDAQPCRKCDCVEYRPPDAAYLIRALPLAPARAPQAPKE